MVWRRNARCTAGVGVGKAELVGFGARKPGHAVGVSQTVALVDLGIDPHFGPLPEPHADIKRDVPSLAALPGTGKIIGALVGRPDCRIV